MKTLLTSGAKVGRSAARMRGPVAAWSTASLSSTPPLIRPASQGTFSRKGRRKEIVQ